MAEEKLLTPTDVAERLQLQERTVTRWLRTGYLRGFKLGKEWRVSSEDLRSFIDHHAFVVEERGSRDHRPAPGQS